MPRETVQAFAQCSVGKFLVIERPIDPASPGCKGFRVRQSFAIDMRSRGDFFDEENSAMPDPKLAARNIYGPECLDAIHRIRFPDRWPRSARLRNEFHAIGVEDLPGRCIMRIDQ